MFLFFLKDPFLGSSDPSGFNPFAWTSDLDSYWLDDRVTGYKHSPQIGKMSKKHYSVASLRILKDRKENGGIEYLKCPHKGCIMFRRSYQLQDTYYYIVNYEDDTLEENFIEYGLSVPVVIHTKDSKLKNINLKHVQLETNQAIVFTISS